MDAGAIRRGTGAADAATASPEGSEPQLGADFEEWLSALDLQQRESREEE